MGNIDIELKFNGYRADNIRLEMNNDFDFFKSQDVQMQQNFQRDILKADEDNFAIRLSVNVCGENGVVAPFNLQASIVGLFTLPKWESDENKMNVVKFNSVAILFPYLRALVSSITSTANIPPYLIPTYNVYNLFNENKQN